MKNASAKKLKSWLNSLPGGGNILAAGKNAPIWQLNNQQTFGKIYAEAPSDAPDNGDTLKHNK